MIDQVRDVCMPKLVRCYLKVKTIHAISSVQSFFAQDGCYSVLDLFPVDVSVIDPLFGRSCDDILPYSTELSVLQRLPIAV